MASETPLFCNFYELLGVKRDAKSLIIQQAYQSKIRETNPDFCIGHSIVHDDETRELEEAREILSDKELRAAYDELVRSPCFSDDAIEAIPKLFTPHGYVYVLQEADERTRYKIGYTNHPFNRFRATVIGPFDFNVVALVKSTFARALENQLHKQYDNKRKRGEWFELSVKQLLEIRSLSGTLTPAAAGSQNKQSPPNYSSTERARVVKTRLYSDRSVYLFPSVDRPAEAPKRPVRGMDIENDLAISLREAFTGVQKQVDASGHKVKVMIPPGVASGDIVRISGKGYAGKYGGSAGDLVAKVTVLGDARFSRNGKHLFTTATVTSDIASRGGKTTVPTVSGSAQLTIPAASESGDRLRLEGYGMPFRGAEESRGDLIVMLDVVESPVRGEHIRKDFCVSLLEAYAGAEKLVKVSGKEVTVSIPPGVASGNILRCKGLGHAGNYGGSAGDLLVKLTVADDARFARSGAQLFTTVEVAADIAARGGTITVPTLSGSETLTIPAAASNGDEIRLIGHGMPIRDAPGAFGDMLAVIRVLEPPVRGRDMELDITLSLREAYLGLVEQVPEVGELGKVSVPAGLASGDIVRCKGKGGLGKHGGENGDLLLRVTVAVDPPFKRKGDDLHTTIEVEERIFARSGVVEVPTITGSVQLTVPCATRVGQTLRLPGYGMPRRDSTDSFGDMLVKLKLAARAGTLRSTVSPQSQSTAPIPRLRDLGHAPLRPSASVTPRGGARRSAKGHRLVSMAIIVTMIFVVAALARDAKPTTSSTSKPASSIAAPTASRFDYAPTRIVPTATQIASTVALYVSTADRMPAVIRQCPQRSAQCAVIGGLLPGDSIKLSTRVTGESIGGNNVWLRFRKAGKQVYIHSGLVESGHTVRPEYAVYTGDLSVARIRLCPQISADCPVIGGLAHGSAIQPQFAVTGQSIAGNFLWIQFRNAGRSAFIHSSLVAPRL